MAVKCIDDKTDFELININTPDNYINDIANNYIQTYHINVQQSTGYTSLLMQISNNLNIDKSDIDKLVYYFNIYVNLCSQCNMLPDMTGYCLLVDVPYDTMQDWLSGQNRSATHTQICKKMREICKLTCVSEASRGNVGAIYISKAIHGLSDAPAPSTYTQNNLYITAPVSREAIAAEFPDLTADQEPLKLPET